MKHIIIIVLLAILTLIATSCGGDQPQEISQVTQTPKRSTDTPAAVLPTLTDAPTSTPTDTPQPTSTSTTTPSPEPTSTSVPPTSTPTEEPTPTPIVASVSANKLNLRGGPGTEYPVVAQLSGGDPLSVLARTEDGAWLKVEIPDNTTPAWAFAELVGLQTEIQDIDLATEIPPTPVPTPTPERIFAKAGTWHGESPTVTFEVGADGNIRNFKMIAKPDPLSTCTITLSQISVKNNSTFNVNVPLFGDIKNQIKGRFVDDELVEGRYILGFCSGQDGNTTIYLTLEGDSSKPWNASWAGE